MSVTQLEHTVGSRQQRRPHVTSLSVDVVDGNGTEVPGEPVVARFILTDGETRDVRAVTDPTGRARIIAEHDSEPLSVEVLAARESTGPSAPIPGARLVIEA